MNTELQSTEQTSSQESPNTETSNSMTDTSTETETTPLQESMTDSQESTSQTSSDSKSAIEDIISSDEVEGGQDSESSAVDFEPYDLDIADDSPLTDEEFDAIAGFASANRLSKDQAEALVKFKEESFAAGKKSYETERAENIKKQTEELFKDPDFSGANRAKSYQEIKTAVKALGDDNLIEALKVPEIGSNVHLAKFLKRIGSMVGDDSTIAKGSGAGSATPKSLADSWYPDM